MTRTVAILAGGLATRLHPLTKTVPKSLVPVAGKPFIEWQLEWLRVQCVQRVVLCVGHLGECIQSYLGNGERYALELLYSDDGESLLGTGGALKQALPLLGDEFLLLYGDSYLPVSFSGLESLFARQKQHPVMAVIKNNNQWDSSNVWFEQDTILEYNKHQPHCKMEYIDYGLSIIPSSVLANFTGATSFDLAAFYHHCSLQGQLQGYEVYSRFYEIGSPQGLYETEQFLKQKGRKT